MREILFRGKSLDTGEWVEGYLCASNISGCFILQTPTRTRKLKSGGVEIYDKLIPIQVDGSTIGQYTDLLDEKGKKIFEGDICIVKENRISDSVTIGFENGAFIALPANGNILEKSLWDIWYNDYSIEVIGNIYDNLK